MINDSQPVLFGMSPCPNDTFAFHALVHGLVKSPRPIAAFMADIEELNRKAHKSELPLTKLSFGALAKLRNVYRPLRSGAALGRGVGPLLVTKKLCSTSDALTGRIAIPGRDTTAFLLLRMMANNQDLDVVELRYDHVLSAVERGDVDAGLIIHESRFTYQNHNLFCVADLGEWWEQKTNLPVPLATICVRSDIDEELALQLETALRASVQFAFDNPRTSVDWIRVHAQEMDDEVQRQHISLYVNEFTLDLEDEGLAAIEALLAAAI